MRRRGALLLLAGLAAGCGDDAPPADPFAKKAPTLPKTWQGRGPEEWLRAASSPDRVARFDAVWALGELDEAASAAAQAAVRDALASEDPDLRLAGLVAAERWGPAAPADLAPLVVARLGDGRLAVREAARRAASRLGPAVVAPLGAALSDASAFVRWQALTALRDRRQPIAGLTDRVLAIRRDDPDRLVRRAALGLLPWLEGTGLGEAIALLVGDDPVASREALDALVAAGPRVVPALREALRAPEDDRAGMAARALADLGPAAAEALPDLLTALRRSGTVRFNVADALVALGEAARPGLTAAASDPDPAVVRTAHDALERLDAAKAGD